MDWLESLDLKNKEEKERINAHKLERFKKIPFADSMTEEQLKIRHVELRDRFDEVWKAKTGMVQSLYFEPKSENIKIVLWSKGFGGGSFFREAEFDVKRIDNAWPCCISVEEIDEQV